MHDGVPEDRDGEVAGGGGRNGDIDQVVATGDMMLFVWTGGGDGG